MTHEITREELHKLVDSMPEAAIETAHQFLLALQVGLRGRRLRLARK